MNMPKKVKTAKKAAKKGKAPKQAAKKVTTPKKEKASKKVELTPKLYIDLTLKMLPILMERMGVEFAKHKEELKQGGPEKGMEIFMGILLNIRLAIGKELLPEGITDEAMERYKEEHEAEIDEYAEQHSEIKKKLDSLQKEFEAKFPQ
jgi:hypothetical protein